MIPIQTQQLIYRIVDHYNNLTDELSVEAARRVEDWRLDKPSLRSAITVFQKRVLESKLPDTWKALLPVKDKGKSRPADAPLESGTQRQRSTSSPPSTGEPPQRGESPTQGRPLTPPTTSNEERRSSGDTIYSIHRDPGSIGGPESRPTTSAGQPNDSHRQRPSYRSERNAMASSSGNDVLSETIQAQISAIVARTVAAVMNERPGPPNPNPNPGLNADQLATASPAGSGFRARDVGFFDPDNDKDPVETKENHQIYHNVYAFTNRIRVKASTSGNPRILRENLDTCLLGKAQTWFTEELDDVYRSGLRNDPNGVEVWASALERRFREAPGRALSTLESTRYTIAHVRRGNDPEQYLQSIMLNGKNSGIATNDHAQVMLAYEHLDPHLRRDLQEPTEATTMAQLTSAMTSKKNLWFDLYRSSSNYGNSSTSNRGRERDSGKQSSINRGHQGGFSLPSQNRYGYNRDVYGYRGGFQGSGFNKERSSNNRQQFQPQQNQPSPSNPVALPASRKPLMITNNAGNARPNERSGGTRNWNTGTGGQNWNRRPYQQSAYQADENDSVDQEAPSSYQSEENPSADDLEREASQFALDAYDSYYNSYGMAPPGSEEPAPDPSSEPSFNEPIDSMFTVDVQHKCRDCKTSFESRNKLHKHLRIGCSPKGVVKASRIDVAKEPPSESLRTSINDKGITIIESNVAPDPNPAYAFRSWQNATIKVGFTMNKGLGSMSIIDACADTGCTASQIDRTALRFIPDVQITKFDKPLTVRGIGTAVHLYDEFAQFDMFIPDGQSGKVAKIRMGARVVEDLKANMLVGNDILGPLGVVVDLDQEILTLKACPGVRIPMKVHPSTPSTRRVDRIVRSDHLVRIPAKSRIMIPIKLRGKTKLPAGRDFMFEPTSSNQLGEGGFVTHIIDSETEFIEALNATDNEVVLPRHTRLGKVTEYEAQGCYPATVEDDESLRRHSLGPVQRKNASWFKKGITMAMAMATIISNGPQSTVALHTNREKPMEGVSQLGITAYGEPEVQQRLFNTAERYPDVWKADGPTIRIPESDWMTIPLVDNAKLDPAKVYPLGPRDREVVDKEFDQLHREGRMEWTAQPTPHGYPVFVVWKALENGERKGRVVVDIRGLNRITITDSYPMPLQTDITAAVADCPYISTMDATSYFHQWPVRQDHRSRITVVSHRGQEQYNVAPMGYKNSPPYVQRQTDNLLRPFRGFARAFIDDIVVFSKNLDDHLRHLGEILYLFERLGIRLKPSKSFLGFPTVKLLGQHVDSLGLTTATDKLKALSRLSFPHTLRDLEIYLGLTGWLRSYVEKYAQKAEPLQRRKTLLLRSSPSISGKLRQRYTKHSVLQPTNEERQAFEAIQRYFRNPKFLAHYSPTRLLLADLDASKKGFGVVVYHVKSGIEKELLLNSDLKYPPRSAVEPVLFLSKTLNPAESRYWPTELEVACLVWTVRRIRHLIESSKQATRVYTDHSATTSIVQQSTLRSTNTDKLNLRLVRASQYLSQFSLDVRHKPGKGHVVPDALSRLSGTTVERAPPSDQYEEGTLESLYAYNTTLIELDEGFKRRVMDGYIQDKQWANVLSMLQRTDDEDDGQSSAKILRFTLNDGLIYHESGRLCIPNTKDLEREIFEMAHDNHHHSGFHRACRRITETIYMRHLSRRLRLYIASCLACQKNQTVRHRPYGQLIPIHTPMDPFHTIAMDFVLALPLIQDRDTLLTVTDKFTKRLLLLPGKNTYSAKDWALVLLDGLRRCDWGLPRAIISDRDAKFMSELWTSLFKALNVKMLTSTAYHPQTDGQSERTNQSVEIALRYWCTENPNKSWLDAIPAIQSSFNNSANQSTGKSANELSYGFRVREALDLGKDLPRSINSNLDLQRAVIRQDALDAVDFANAMAKLRYDSKHQPLRLNVGDSTYLQLHRGYHLVGKDPNTNTKLSERRIGPFKILEKVGHAAYRLELPPRWRIHPVISVSQLEPVLANDEWDRPKPTEPPPIAVDGDTEEWRSYEIERLVDDRIRRFGNKHRRQYLVRWVGYGKEHDDWYDEDLLSDASGLIEDYWGLQKRRPMPEEKARTSRRLKKRATRKDDQTTKHSETKSNDAPSTDLVNRPPKRGRGRPRKAKQ